MATCICPTPSTAPTPRPRRPYQPLPAGAAADFADNNAYWAGWEGPVRTVGESVYDSFLRSYGQDLGMQSYGACVDLLVEHFLPLCGPTE